MLCFRRALSSRALPYMESTTVTLRQTNAQLQIHCPSAIASQTPLSTILKFPPLVHWLDALDRQDGRVEIRSLTIQSVDEFRSGKVGFLKFTTDATHQPEGRQVPGIVFLRGGAVAMLIILRTPKSPRTPLPSCQDTDFVVLTEQPRIAVPHFHLRELPAGMLDSSGEFSGTAAREIHEETGLVIKPHDLIDLTPDDTSDGLRGLYPSSGACDEFIRLFACEKLVSEDDLDKLRGKLSGLRDDGEFITLRLVRLCDLWKETRDMKATAAMYLWDRRQPLTNKSI
ncbi:hypothetical protein GGF46_003438 [Coemansia sp. RSA 552]|nr:hypothetical protein GGF46_003438 [Coemansia sp. RSA 552]